jgi:cytochrome c oxidase subunit 4
MSDSTHAADHGQHEQHGSYPLYFAVGVGLLVLTFISFMAPRVFSDAPGVMRTVMLTVSCCKALLVILFFMHLKWEANWKYVLTFPAMAMSLFLMLMLVPDVGWRDYHISRERALYMAVPAADQPHEPAAGEEEHKKPPPEKPTE